MHAVDLSCQWQDIKQVKTGRDPGEGIAARSHFEHRMHRSEHVPLTGFPEIYLINTNLKR